MKALTVAVGLMGVAMAMVGCGGSGGGASKQIRLLAVGSGSASYYSVSESGALTQLAVYNNAGQIRSVIPGDASGSFYISQLNSDAVLLAKFDLNGMVSTADSGLAAPDAGSVVFKHPSKPMVYSLATTSNMVSQGTIQANGSLTPAASASVVVGSKDLAFSGNGQFAYVAYTATDEIGVYAVGATGLIGANPMMVVNTVDEPAKLIVSDDGANLYVMSSAGGIGQFAIQGGNLVALNPAVIPYASANFRAAMTGNGVLSFYREDDEGIDTYGRTVGGVLTNLGAANVVTSAVTDVYRLPGTNMVLLLTASGSGRVMAMGSDGVGSQLGTVSFPAGVKSLALTEF
jgi:6-phosphogluconolactonase (cycloisomerase 2 family)